MEFQENKFKPPSNREHLYQQVLEQSDVCDVTIQVGEWKKNFHWCVLILSPFFDSLRRNDFIEKQTGMVTLTATSILAVESSILFLYGKKPKLTEQNVADILELAEFLMIPNLKCACIRFLRDISITDENCMNMLDIASLYNIELVKCVDYIRGHLQDILQKREARRLTKESVIDLLTDPFLTFVNGEEKFNFLVDWAKAFKRNEIAFPEVFDAIDLGDIIPDFWDTCVINHPLVVNMIGNRPNSKSRSILEDHRVLIFTGLSEEYRIACFDLEREKWYGLETPFPDHVATNINYWNYSLKGIRNEAYSDIYKVDNYTHKTVYKQDLRSMNVTECRISVLNHEGSISNWLIAEEACVGAFNENAPRELDIGALRPIYSLGGHIVDYREALLLNILAQRNMERNHFIKSNSTVVYGKLQYPETTAEPILTILNAKVKKLSMNNLQVIGLLTDDLKTLYIYNVPTCELDTIDIASATNTDKLLSGYDTKLTATDDGFLLYDKKYAFSVSRLHGPALVDKYTVQHLELGTDPTWNKIGYYYCNNTWFRTLKKTWNDDVEFASVSHQSLVNKNEEDITWKPLPATRKIDTLKQTEHVFMIRLPKSGLKCHVDCPHCKQLKEEKVAASRSHQSARTADSDESLYDDSDNEDYPLPRYMYDWYDDSDEY